jgi:predicted O-methyltransferase YrrM
MPTLKRNLTRRRAILLGGVAVLGAVVAVSALTGHFGVALTALTLLVVLPLGGLVLMARRLSALQRANQRAQGDLRVVLDQTQRRLLGAVEELLLNAGDRHRELTEALAAQQKAVAHGTDLLLRAQTREVEALLQLFHGFSPRAPMPSSGGFALNPTDLLGLLHLVRTRRPRLVLELGSGTSTVWLAYVLKEIGGRLISLDHDAGYAAKTQAHLAEHGLSDVAEVREAPLEPVLLEGRSFPWYASAALDDLRGVDLLVIDGPPEKTGKDARYPAMRVLENRLADAATVIFDDAHRKDEQAAMRKWVETIEGLTPEGEALGRHAVLSYRRIVRQLTPSSSQ